MKNWRVELAAEGKKNLVKVNIQRSIFQRDTLLLIIICNRDDATQPHT